MSWRDVTAADITLSFSERANDRNNLPVYSVTKHAGFVPSLEYFKKQVFSRNTSDYKFVPRHAFAYATIHLDEGAVGYAHEDCLISPMYTVFRADGSCVDRDYLLRFLKSPAALNEYSTMGTGTVHRRKAISYERFAKLRIPLPPLDEQRRIAAILDQADDLRRKRRETLNRVGQLAEADFHSRFGSPALNPMGWPRRTIGELCKVITGNTPSRANEAYYGSAIEWIKSDNIDPQLPYLTRATEGLSDSGKAVARVVPSGSILVTCIAGSPNSIGNAAMTNREVAFNQQINALVPDQIDIVFLYWQLKFGKALVQEASTKGMKGLVSKSRLEAVQLISPPLELQLQYRETVSGLMSLQAKHRSHLAQLDALFASLQHRAFRGEL